MNKNREKIDENPSFNILNQLNENDFINKEKKDSIQIEFSNGEIIKEEIITLTKYPNSVLSACINGKISLPKRNGHFFLDRNYDDFKLLLYFLKKSKLPKFQNYLEEKNFFKEMKFWRIPIKVSSKKRIQFDIMMTSNCFNLDKTKTILSKKNNFHGITLLNIALKATSPFVEFIIYANNYLCNNKKLFFGVVDKSIFNSKHLKLSFEDKTAPFVFYWDLFRNKIIKNKTKAESLSLGNENECKCFLNMNEMKIGMKYNHLEHSVGLYINDIELGVEIQNIIPGLCPAIELHMEDCKIKLSSNTDYQEPFYL